MNPTLISRVATLLDSLSVPYALVGAAALAVHGIARSTFDLDLFTTSTAVLDATAWAELAADPDVCVTVRRGDGDDPLAGVVRVEVAGEREVDVVVGRTAWQSEAIGRAEPVRLAGVVIPVVTPADLILFKLYAGGAQDAWDIEQLLGSAERSRLVRDVESRLERLPPSAAGLWARIVRP